MSSASGGLSALGTRDATFNLTLNLTITGDYDINYTINDSLAHNITFNDFFESIALPLNISGNVTDSTGALQNYTVKFFRPDTNITLFNFTNNSYILSEQQINQRIYDLQIEAGNNVFFFENLNMSTAYLPVNVENFSVSVVNVSLYKVLTATAVNSSYSGNATLNLSYNGLYDSSTSAVAESGLTIHRCSDWNYSGRVCNTNFALYDTKGVFTAADRVIVNTSNFSAFLITEYTCGNSICSAAFGETTATCPTDCATPSSSASAGGGGGGGGGGTAAASAKTSDAVGAVQINIAKIDRELNIGENITEQITIVNTKDVPLNVDFRIDPNLKDMFEISSSATVPGGRSLIVPIRIKGIKEGVYQGNLFIVTPLYNQTIPIIVLVKSRSEKLLDVTVAVDKKIVSPGEEIPFRITAFNLGQLKRYDLLMRYEIVNKKTNITLSHFEESAAIETSISLSRKMEIPEDASHGPYILYVTAHYGELKASSSISFEVGYGSVPFIDIVKDYAPLVVLMLFFLVIVLGAGYYFVSMRKKVFQNKVEEMQKNSVYPFPDFATLPQNKYAYIGLIADSKEKAYFDPTQLTRHTLIAGGTGSGKTVAGMILVEELMKKGTSVIVLDPVGQWTGFVKKNEDKQMKERYKKFGLKGGQAFAPRIISIDEKTSKIDVLHYLNLKDLTILRLDGLTPAKADTFVESVLEQIYRAKLPETSSLKSLVVLDEVHRLLPKYGGHKAYTKLEQAVREFRKWGIGLLMISQVLTDFKGAIRGNIGTEIQMRSRYEGDIKRVRERHGQEISRLISKMPTGLGMIEGSEYNRGNPYFVEFRPLLHSPLKLSEREVQSIVKKESVVFRQDISAGSESKEKIVKREKNKPDHRAFLSRIKKKKVKLKKEIVKKNKPDHSKFIESLKKKKKR